MNLEQIKSFVSVAKFKSFSQAARDRYLSQPAISNQLKALEEEMKCQLLVRTPKEVTLTEQGQVFYSYAMKMMMIEKDMKQQLNESNLAVQGTIDIIAPHLQTDRLLADFMVEAVRTYPDITYRIVEREDSEISGRVASGEVELGITSEVTKNHQLVYEPCFIEEIVLITPNNEYYRDMTFSKLQHILLNDGYIRFDFGNGSDYLWNNFFGKTLNCDLHNIATVARCSNFNITIKAVEEGLGIAFISNTIIRNEVMAGRVLAYRFRSLLEKQFYIVYQKERMALSLAEYNSKELLKKVIHDHYESMNHVIIDKFENYFSSDAEIQQSCV